MISQRWRVAPEDDDQAAGTQRPPATTAANDGMTSSAQEEITARVDLLKLAPRAARARRRGWRVSVLVRRQKQPEFELALDQDSTLIGRDPGCDIVLDDDGISRRHARIDRLETGYHELVDLSSTNGTLVAGRPLQRMVLLDGDRFTVGDTRFTFRSSPVDDVAGGARG